MTILFMMIPLSLLLASFFVLAFLVSLKKGQFEDLDTPAHSLLLEDSLVLKKQQKTEENHES